MAEEFVKRTELSEIGEFGLIDRLTGNIRLKHASSVKGVGDDAAVIKTGRKLMLVTKDLMVEGPHFDLSYFPLRHLGYKAAVVNFSDIIAMNGTPKQMIVGLAVSNRFSLEALEEIYDGLNKACDVYQVDLVGGDTVASPKGLFISITVIGEVEQEDVVYRSGAAENDILCVSGDLGGAYAGLLILEREKQVFKANAEMQPELSGHDYVLARQIKPEARTDIVRILKAKGIKPTAMIDISDGLASEVLHLCKESTSGCALYEDKIPMDPSTIQVANEFNIDPVVFALSGGEDYELLFTVSPKDYEKVKEIPELSLIGYMTDVASGANLISRSGSLVPLTAQGWDAFRK